MKTYAESIPVSLRPTNDICFLPKLRCANEKIKQKPRKRY